MILGCISSSLAVEGPHEEGTNVRRFIYTESNSTGANFVLAYSAAPDGTLTELPGSPFPTGGQGDGVRPPLGDSDHGLAIQGGHYLLASNRGSGSVTVFRIHTDGTLTPVPSGPVTVGNTPVSITVHRDLVFVLNFGTGTQSDCLGCGYRGFRMDREGKLTPMSSAVFDLPASPSPLPFSIRFSPDGRYLIGTEFGTNLINVLKVERGEDPDDVRLTPVSGSPFRSVGNQPFGVDFSPVHPDQFFVSVLETPAFPPDRPGDVSSYSLGEDGKVTPLVASPVSTGGQRAPCWTTLTHDGQLLFTANTASGSISSFQVARDGQMTLVGVTHIPHGSLPPGLTGPVDMAVSSDDKFLYVPTLGVASVVGFKIETNGNLVPVEDPLAITIPHSIPLGMVVVDMHEDSDSDR